jgi:hypothetical protein
MKKVKIKSTLLFFAILFVALFLFVFSPFLAIWAINTLFNTSIALTWMNWFAFLVLLFVLKVGVYYGNNK